jgi:glutaminyl-peptide cyclotransferase
MQHFLRNKTSWIVGILLLAFLAPYGASWFGIGQQKVVVAPTSNANKAVAPTQQVPVPQFSADSAFAYVKKQVDFGPRVPNSAAHKKCAAWLADKFKSRGLAVIEQPVQGPNYKGGTWTGVNIIGQYKPEQARRILVAAHWDSRFIADKDDRDTLKPILGADDGGSGVGVILELARLLQKSPVDIGVDFILFDLEDQGDDDKKSGDNSDWCLGAQHWSKNMHRPGYRPDYAILLDMVGAKGAQFKQEGVSMEVAPQFVEKVWNLASSLGHDQYFIGQKVQGITDDHYFVIKNARIPMINVVSMPNIGSGENKIFGDYHHTHDDNMNVIDPNVLRAVGEVMTHVIYQTYNKGGTL